MSDCVWVDEKQLLAEGSLELAIKWTRDLQVNKVGEDIPSRGTSMLRSGSCE